MNQPKDTFIPFYSLSPSLHSSLNCSESCAAASTRWYYRERVAEVRIVLGDNDVVKSNIVLGSTILLGFIRQVYYF